MTGTIVNAVAVAVGGTIGLLCRKGIKEEYKESINRVLGLTILVIGINGVIGNMFTVDGTRITSSNELLLVVFMVIGTLVGELLKLENHFTNFCNKIDKKFKNGGFAGGFINSTLIFCIGAMAIIGSINDGIKNDPSVLFVKSALDFTTAIILSATLGFGVIFSFIPIFLYQGGITLLAGVLSGVLVGEVLTQMCMVGYAIIMAIGINFIFGNKFRTLNMVPSLLLPVIYHYILLLIGQIKG